jgi:hypothetical protein
LVPPANGQMQQIIVKEDVGIPLQTCWMPHAKHLEIDHEDQTLCFWRHSTKCQVRPGSLRVLHRSPGQASPELGPSKNSGLNWYP